MTLLNTLIAFGTNIISSHYKQMEPVVMWLVSCICNNNRLNTALMLPLASFTLNILCFELDVAADNSYCPLIPLFLYFLNALKFVAAGSLLVFYRCPFKDLRSCSVLYQTAIIHIFSSKYGCAFHPPTQKTRTNPTYALFLVVFFFLFLFFKLGVGCVWVDNFQPK